MGTEPRGPGGPPHPAHLPRPDLGVGAARRPHLPQPGRRHLHPRAHLPRPLPHGARAVRRRSPRSCRPSPGSNGSRTTTTTPAPTSTPSSSSTSSSGSVNRKLLGEHNLQIKDRFYTEREVRKQSRPGDTLYELNGTTPLALTTYYANDPRYEEARYGWFIGTDTLTKNVVTLRDNWRPTRHLTVTPSLSHVYAKAGNSAGDDVINTGDLGPRAGRRLGRHPRRAHGGAGQRQQLRRSRHRRGRSPHHRQPGPAALHVQRRQRHLRQQLRVQRRALAQHHRACPAARPGSTRPASPAGRS